MKALLAATLLATCVTTQAEVHQKTMKIMCGSQEDFLITAEKYGELPIIVSADKENHTINSLWGNVEKGTTSWMVQLVDTDEWCMLGIGTQIVIPEDSPIRNTPTGEKVIYK